MLHRPTCIPAKTPASPRAALIVTCNIHRLSRPSQLSALQRPDFQQRQGSSDDELSEDEQQQLVRRPEPPGRRYNQLWKAKRPRRKPRLLDAPRDPSHSLWGTTKRQRKAALQQALQEQYGPHAGDRDVRLYLQKRGLNEARHPRGTRRGGLPLDDSFDKPGTFLKLSPAFQRTVLLERVDELVSTLHRLSPESAWQLYSTTPGLLTSPTMEVAQRLTGLAAATGLSLQAAVQYLCAFRPLAFVGPDTVASRVGLLAKVGRLERGAAVVLMQQHPALWLISSKLLAPRVEQLSLLLCCCPVTSLRLIGTCPDLLGAPLHTLQQQLAALYDILGTAGRPTQVVPLLLWCPACLLGTSAWPQQQQEQQQQQQEEEEQQEEQQQQEQEQEQQQQEQEQEQEQQQDAAPTSSSGELQQQLQHLSTALGQLPLASVQEMVLRCPDVLQLAAPGSSAAAAAVDSLCHSWLMSPDGAAVQHRQQYQQQLVQVLQPHRYSNVAKRRKVRQPGGHTVDAAAGWYDAAQAVEAAVVGCQWWDKPLSPPSSHQQQPQQQQLSTLQQLVLQAPGLLVLTVVGLQRVDAGGGRLGARLQVLCDQLQQLLDSGDDLQQLQQQVQLLAAVRHAAVLEPCILTQPPGWVLTQLQQLSGALQVPAHSMLSLWLQHPCILWLTQAQVFEAVRVLCGLLSLPARQVKQLLAQQPDAVLLMLVRPEALKKGFAVAAREAAGGHGALASVLRQQPAALLPGHQGELHRLLNSSVKNQN